MEGNIHCATGEKYLPVAIMEALKTTSRNTGYKVDTKLCDALSTSSTILHAIVD